MIEPLELRIAPATLFVGKASNFAITTDTGPVGLSAGDTVSFSPDVGSVHSAATNLVFGTRAFDNLTTAISAATSGDTIRVATGIYTVTSVNKSLIFLGAQASRDTDFGRTDLARESVLDVAASGLALNSTTTLDGFTIQTGSTTATSLRTSTGGGEIRANVITGGMGMEVRNAGFQTQTIHDNRIEVSGTGMVVTNAATNLQITSNVIEAGAVGIQWSPTAGTGVENVVRGNSLSGPGLGGGESGGTGIEIAAGIPASTTLLIRENFIRGWATGVAIEGELPAAGFLTVRANQLTGNTVAIDHNGAATLSAPFNFFGSEADTAAEVDAVVDGNVDFEPFALDGTTSDGETFRARLEENFTFTGNTFTYPDVDGDEVTVTVTRGSFAEHFVQMDAPNVGEGFVLSRLFLSDSGAGGDVIVSVRRAPGGDGFVNVGQIFAQVDLRKVIVRGDLNAILAGDSTPETPALKLLQVTSMGVGGFATGFSTVTGKIVQMNVANDFAGRLFVTGAAGRIDKLTIGGALMGLAGVDDSGRIEAEGLGVVTIRGGIESSDGERSGVLLSRTSLTSLTLGASITGPEGTTTANVEITGSAKSIVIQGGITPSTAANGSVRVGGSLDVLRVAGSVLGGVSVGGSMKTLTIGGELGTFGVDTRAEVRVEGSVRAAMIGGNVIGGGRVFSGSLTIGGSVQKLGIAGSVIGGPGFGAGEVQVAGSVAAFTLGGSVIGGEDGGAVEFSGPVKTVLVRGSIIGGTASQTGVLGIAGFAKNVTVLGSVIGGSQTSSSGRVTFSDGVGNLVIGGSIAALVDSDAFSGHVQINGPAGSVLVRGSVLGGPDGVSGIDADQVGTLRVMGDVLAPGTDGARIQMERVKSLFIGGDVRGSDGGVARVQVRGEQSPANATEALAAATIMIRGSLERARIDIGGVSNPDVIAGTVTIGGDFRSSSIAVGINDGADNKVGTDDDALPSVAGFNNDPAITASIAKIVIGGAVTGNEALLSDRHGIVAQAIGALVIGGVSLPLTSGLDDLTIGAGMDVRIRELQ